MLEFLCVISFYSIGAKAAKILGYHFRAVQVVPDEHLSLTGGRLRVAFEEDIQTGLVIFVLFLGSLLFVVLEPNGLLCPLNRFHSWLSEP